MSSPPRPTLVSFSLVTLILSQTYDDLDLENEPWYKFFSELEFGRPVSQDQSYSRNRSPAVVPYTQFIHSTQLFFSTNKLGGATCLGM